MREGERLGEYILLEKVAQGGMAEIFRAEKRGARGFSRELCIKRIRPALCNDRAFVEMFIDEAHTASRLRHSNIVAIDDFGEVDGQLYACMEWVHGTDASRVLRRLVDGGRAFPLDAGLFVTVEVLKALEYAHDKLDAQGRPLDIIHRDVSPHNILISFAGEVRLTDFGIAKASSRLHQTTEDVVKGKAAYLAPEQARSQPIDRRVDLFALGVVTFELLAGQRPFQGDRESDLILAIVRGQRPALSALRPDIPPPVEAFVHRLLAVSRDDRYASATEALEHLTRLGGSYATGARALVALMAQEFPAQASVLRDGAWLRASTDPGSPSPHVPYATPVALAPTHPLQLRDRDSAPPTDAADVTDIDRAPFREPDPTHPELPGSLTDVTPRPHHTHTERTPTFTPTPTPTDPETHTLTALTPSDEVSRTAVTRTLSRPREDLPEPFVPSPTFTDNSRPGRSSVVLWGIIGGAMLLVGVGWFALRPREVAPVAPREHPPAPAPAAPVAPVAPVDAASRAAAPAEDAPSVVAATRDAASAVTPEPPRAHDARLATLRVLVIPWGDLTVDGSSRGSSRAPVRLAPGRHRVSARQGDRVLSREVELRPGEQRAVTFDFRQP